LYTCATLMNITQMDCWWNATTENQGWRLGNHIYLTVLILVTAIDRVDKRRLSMRNTS
jgi:hypothetical protein